MSYNKKVWKSGDRITKEALNNMENGIEAAHQNSGGSGTSYDDTEIKTDISTIKTDLGTEELTTTAKDVKGAVNEVAAQYKDIANLFTTEQTTNSYKIKYGNKVIAEIPLGSSVPTVIKYTITNTLSNATNSNSVTEIEENQSYTATITPNKGYSINSAIITMGGTNICLLYTSDAADD